MALFENVLNFFTFDCTSENEGCGIKATKVRSLFANLHIELLTNGLMMIRKQLSKFKAGGLGYKLLCNEQLKWPLLDLSRALRRLVFRNDTKLLNEIIDILSPIYLMPEDKYINQFIEKLSQLDHGEESEDVSNCNNNVNVADGDTIFTLSATLLMFGSGKDSHVPFGTFIRTFLNGQNEDIKQAEIQIEHLLAEELEIQNGPGIFEHLHCYSSKYPHICKEFKLQNSDALKGKLVHSQAFDLTSLHLENFFSFKKAKEIYRNIAIKLAAKLNLDANVILPLNSPQLSPALWYCQLEADSREDCFDFKASVTKSGIGFTMNMNNWKDTFKSKVPLINQYEANDDLRLTAKNEIVLYVHDPRKRG